MMTFLIKDRIKETSTTIGTGSIFLGGEFPGFQSFGSTIANGNTTVYVFESIGGPDWEIGVGSYDSVTNSISRDSILSSSNSGSIVDFPEGPKNVFVTIPAAYSSLTIRGLEQFANTTSANLSSIVPDSTGSGSLVFADSPELTGIENSCLVNNSVTVTAGIGLDGGGSVALGSSITISANTASTTSAGIVRLIDSVSNTSTTTAATANSVKIAYDLANIANINAANASVLSKGTVPVARLSGIPNSSLSNSTISGVQLGSNLESLTIGTGLSGSSYNGYSATTISIDSTVATLSGTQILNNKTISNGIFSGLSTNFSNTNNATGYSTAPVTFSGGIGVAKSLYIGQDLNVSGNVYISGNTTTLSSNNLSITDSLIYLAQDNPANLNDIGFVGHFTSTSYQHTGLVRDASDGVWKLFSNVATEPTSTIDFTTATYDTLKVGAVIGLLYGNANTVTNGVYTTDTGTVTNAMLSGGITNNKLSNTSVTVTAGIGLDGGGSVALGSSITISANTGSTTVAGILQLTDSISSTSTTTAATANSVKIAYDLANTANTNLKDANNLITGTVGTARLGTGSADSTTYLRGDGTWSTISAGGATLSAVDNNTTYYIGLSSETTGSWTDARVDVSNLYYTSLDDTLYATNFNTASDQRLKEHIQTIEHSVETVNQLRGVGFNWKSTGAKNYGVIAQELEQVLPELVNTVDDRKSVNYSALIGFLIEAVKELSVRVEELERR